jgi:ABC-type phosphate transport system substrate-binding protein
MNPDGSRYSSSVEMVNDLAADRYGISFSDMGSDRPGVRAVPIGGSDQGPFVPISLASLRDRSYPLFIEQWAQVRLAPGKRLRPLVKEFLTFMLSREGQDAIQRDGKWITLPEERAAEMRTKLNAAGEAVDRRTLGLHLDHLAPSKWDGESPAEVDQVKSAPRRLPAPVDLSALPAYQPSVPLTGTIRMPASGQFMTGELGPTLIEAFRRYHPGIAFSLKDGDLVDGEVDVSVGRKWSSYFSGEFYDFQIKHNRSPREIQVAGGSFDIPGWNPAIAIYVGADNPVAGLTILQLDGIFGGPRRGGWVSTAWRRQAGRGVDANIRNWRQLGVAGPCADQPITVYVPPVKYHIMSVFERKVLVGGNMWNDNVQEIPMRVDSQGRRSQPGRERVEAVARSRCGITFADVGTNVAGARTVAVARDAAGPFVLPSETSVQDRSYPLHLETYAYTDARPSQPIDARVREFLSFILSREGQTIIARGGRWLPLPPSVAAAQRAKLDEIVAQVTVQ